jgi:hypothetical protein
MNESTAHKSPLVLLTRVLFVGTVLLTVVLFTGIVLLTVFAHRAAVTEERKPVQMPDYSENFW